jgi:hypothetical protein
VRAPVYRHLDVKSGLLGLSIIEWTPMLLAFWFALVANRPNLGLLLVVAGYFALRAATRGRPESFLEHTVLWLFRRRVSGGRLSAAARASAPRFPFAPYACRDVAPNGRGAR